MTQAVRWALPSTRLRPATPVQQNGTASYATTTTTVTPGTYLDCFGTSASPINYIIPANTTRVLSLKADIQSTANFARWSAAWSPRQQPDNLQGLISSQSAYSAGAQGSSLSLATSLLTVSKNSAYGNQNITPNSTAAHIGSYTFTASSASGAQINTVGILVGTSTNNNSGDIQNLKLMINGVQFGTTQGVVSDGSTYTFSGAPFTVPAGGTTYVDVYADVLSGAASMSPATSLSSCSGMGTVSYNAVSCSGTQGGQNLTVASAGATMTVGLDSSAPAATNLVMGSTGNVLASYRFAETTNYENVKITDLTIVQNSSSSKSSFQNIGIYNGSTALGTAGSAVTLTAPTSTTATITIATATSSEKGTFTVVVDGFNVTTASQAAGSASGTVANALAALSYPMNITAATGTDATGGVVTLTASGGYHTLSVTTPQHGLSLTGSRTIFGTPDGGYTYTFHFGTPVIVPQSNSVTLTLKGDVASYSSQGASDNTTSTFQIGAVTALGASSNLATNVTGGAVGNKMTVLRTVVTPSAMLLGVASNRSKSAVDNLATVTFTANTAGAAMLKSMKLTFSGNAIATSTATSTGYNTASAGFATNLTLRDANNNDVVGSDNATYALVCTSQSACTVTWTFSTGAGAFIISPGTSYSFTVQANTTAGAGTLANGATGTQGMGATIAAYNDVSYYDTGDTTGNVVYLPSTIVPLSVASFSFNPGS